MLLAPARIPHDMAQAAQRLAEKTVQALGGAGVFGVEMFLTREGELPVNEVAPRPHNSGHYTYEACVVSQFEQHIRAIAGLPLGSTELMRAAAMMNLLGEPGESGLPELAGFAEALAIPGVIVHVYGKAETRPFRKMGHVTVLDEDLEEARRKALRVKQILQVRAAGGAV
jgi:5-(carboxyamino)imidazole ribonucleotide synthase